MTSKLSLPAKVGAGAGITTTLALGAAGASGAFSSAEIQEPTEAVENSTLEKEDNSRKVLQEKIVKEYTQKLELSKSKAKQPDIKLKSKPANPTKPIKLLSDENLNKYGEDKVGGVYARILVLETAEEEKDYDNEQWWKVSAYNFNFNEQKNQQVRDSNNPFDGDEKLTEASIKAKCKSIYEMSNDDSNLRKTPALNIDKTGVSIWDDLLTNCSLIKATPFILDSEDEEKKQNQEIITFKDKLKSKLLSYNGNKLVWKPLNDYFFKQEESSISSQEFKGLKAKEKTITKATQPFPLQTKCNEMYEKKIEYVDGEKDKESTDEKKLKPESEQLEKDLIKYCTLEGK